MGVVLLFAVGCDAGDANEGAPRMRESEPVEATAVPGDTSAKHAEEKRLLDRLAKGHEARSLTIDPFAVTKLSHEIKTLVVEHRWGDLDRRSGEIILIAEQAMAIAAADLAAARSTRSDVARLAALMPEVDLTPLNMYPDLIEDSAPDVYDEYGSLRLDAMRAKVLGAIGDARGDVELKEIEAHRTLDLLRQQIGALRSATHAALVRGDRSELQRALDTTISEAPRLASELALLTVRLRGDGAAAMDESRRWAARLAMEANVTLRWCWTSVAIATWLSRHALTDWDRLVHDADSLALDPTPTAAQIVAADDLVGRAELLDGQFVTVEGFVTASAFTIGGGKRNTYLSVASGRADARPLRVRAHFVNLASRGITATSYVRVTGRFHRAADWADGHPGIDLKRASLAQSTSWIDRMVHAATPCFEQWPGGMLIEWSLVHGKPAELDLLAAPTLRSFRDADPAED